MEPINPQESVSPDLMKQMESIQQMPPVAPVTPPTPQPASSEAMTYAGFWRRFFASLIDGIILYAIVMIFFGFLMNSANSNPNLVGSWLGGLQWPLTVAIYAYSIVFIGWKGQTLGKQFLSIKVVTATGGQVSWVQAIVREVFKIVSSYALLLGYLWMLWDKDKQTWHDKVSKTYVIKIK